MDSYSERRLPALQQPRSSKWRRKYRSRVHKKLLNCGGHNALFEQGRGAALRIKTLSHVAHDDTIY